VLDQVLRRHGDDPARGLAALATLDPGLLATLADLGSPAAADRDHAMALDEFATQLPAAGGTAGAAAAAVAAAGHRYRRLRPHARGGLGEVCVALARELNREVARKEIPARP